MSFYDIGKKIVKTVFTPFFRIEVRFEEDFPRDRGVILACNHVSDLDPIILGIACPVQIHYMAKQELFRVPVLGFIIKKLEAFPVARGKGDTGAVNRAAEIVRAGGVLGIFPEGGRSRDGKFHKVKSGTAVIASQTGADIVPAGITYEKCRWFRRRIVHVRLGKVIKNAELNVGEKTKTELRAANELLAGRIAGLLEETP